jgi:hypothetical protein
LASLLVVGAVLALSLDHAERLVYRTMTMLAREPVKVGLICRRVKLSAFDNARGDLGDGHGDPELRP